MNVQITPEVEQLVSDIFVAGQFENKTDVLTEALRLYRRRQQLIADVNEGVEQLNRGETVPAEEVFGRLTERTSQLDSLDEQ